MGCEISGKQLCFGGFGKDLDKHCDRRHLNFDTACFVRRREKFPVEKSIKKFLKPNGIIYMFSIRL